jgi:hypothetical protein
MDMCNYKEFVKILRSNINIRLQVKTNYGRNELYNILDAAMIDSLADVLDRVSQTENEVKNNA